MHRMHRDTEADAYKLRRGEGMAVCWRVWRVPVPAVTSSRCEVCCGGEREWPCVVVVRAANDG